MAGVVSISTNKNLGYEQVTDVSSAAGLASIPAGAEMVILQVESQTVRWRDDGTNPTTSVGMQLKVGETLVYMGQLNRIKFIEETATAKVNASYYSV